MKAINLEDEVFAELDKYTNKIISHSDVVNKLLKTRGAEIKMAPIETSTQTLASGGLLSYVRGAEYQMLRSGINKYLAVLGWLHKTYQRDFQKVEGYKRGNRVYFARSKGAVESGGNGAIHAKQIPGSQVWTLATLDNRSKRTILADLLRLYGFKPDEINIVISTISDSGRHLEKLLDTDSL